MSIRFKFRSAVDFDSVQIEGNGIHISALKERIVEQKNLGKGPNLDLVITNAESGEEYVEDDFLPKNTSVIIKRVPARRAKSTVLVHDEFVEVANDQQLLDRDDDSAQLALTSTMDDLYDMDDFGVDLYAVDESALTNVEADEINNASSLKEGERRIIQDISLGVRGNMIAAAMRSTVKGHGFGRTVPPAGYICHRCNQPGHFIQHCPTNGDPAYDVKRGARLKSDIEGPCNLTGAMTQSSFIKEVDPVPAELRCPLCQGIFKEAVMIPCCQYSFCDTCIRQALLEKGMCPQCCSEKTKSGDLLPNVALRQAIDRFMGSRRDSRLHGEDVESTIKTTKVCPQNQPQIRDISNKVIDNQPELPVVDDSVCESAIGSKGMDATDSGRAEEEEVAEASFVGKKKKKQHIRSASVSESVLEPMAISKLKKSNRFCYICGSPEHLARYCTANGGDNTNSYAPQRGMFHPVHPRGMTPYGQEMYWPGHPLMHVRPLPMAYGEGMYGSCSAMSYGVPTLPVGPYGVPSFTPPVYPNPALHGFLGSIAPRMMVPKERPLSRAEFMELQDRERKRRLTHEREQSEQRAQSVGDDEESFSSASDQSLIYKRPPDDRHQGNSWRLDHGKNHLMGSENKQKHVRRHSAESLDEDAFSNHFYDSEDDSTFEDSKDHRQHSEKKMQKTKFIRNNSKVSEKLNFDREELQAATGRPVREGSKKIFSEKHDVTHEKHEYYSHVKHDCTKLSKVEVNTDGSHSSRHKSKRPKLQGVKMVVPDDAQVKEIKKHRHHVHNEEGSETDRKQSEKKYHNQVKQEVGDYISADGTKKKRKHRRHRTEASKEAVGGDKEIEVESLHHKKYKSRHSSSKLRSRELLDVLNKEDDIEGGRWQMQDGLDDDTFVQLEKPKHKHHHHHHRSSRSGM